MADNNNEGKISIASIIAMICLAGLGFVTFLGLLFASESTAKASIVALVFVALLFFFVKMGIKAKKATDNPDKWQIVGWVCVALYVITAIIPFFMEPYMRFFYVSSQKDELLQAAANDFQAVETFYSDYDTWRKSKLDNAQARLEVYVQKSDKSKYSSLNEYAKKINGANHDDVSSWRIDGDRDTEFKRTSLDSLKNLITSWQRMKIANAAEELDHFITSLNDKFAEHQQIAEQAGYIPEITAELEFTGYAKYDGNMPSNGSQFKSMLNSEVKYSAWGIISYIVLHLLILLYYFSSRGSGVVDIKRNSGMDLAGSTRL